MILPDFRDSLVFRDFEVSSAVLEAAVKKICNKNFRDHSEIHENHKNIRPWKLEPYGMLVKNTMP